jgi:hypothetical protein
MLTSYPVRVWGRPLVKQQQKVPRSLWWASHTTQVALHSPPAATSSREPLPGASRNLGVLGALLTVVQRLHHTSSQHSTGSKRCYTGACGDGCCTAAACTALWGTSPVLSLDLQVTCAAGCGAVFVPCRTSLVPVLDQPIPAAGGDLAALQGVPGSSHAHLVVSLGTQACRQSSGGHTSACSENMHEVFAVKSMNTHMKIYYAGTSKHVARALAVAACLRRCCTGASKHTVTAVCSKHPCSLGALHCDHVGHIPAEP